MNSPIVPVQQIQAANAQTFFYALYGKCKEGCLIFVSPKANRRIEMFDLSQPGQLDAAIRFAISDKAKNCYLKLNLFDGAKILQREHKTGNPAIGNRSEVLCVVAWGTDIDEAYKDPSRYLMRAVILGILNSHIVPPTMIVGTRGNTKGLHVYWIFSEPIRIQDAAHYNELDRLAKRWLRRLSKTFEMLGGSIDATIGMERLYRPAGNERFPEKGSTLAEYVVVEHLGQPVTLDSLSLPPDPYEPTERQFEPTDSENSIIGKFLDYKKVDIYDLLDQYGWQDQGDGFYRRPDANGSMPSARVWLSADDRLGLTIKTSGEIATAATDDQGQPIRYKFEETPWWISRECFWVLMTQGSREQEHWTDAAQFARSELPSAPELMLGPDLLSTAERAILHLAELGFTTPFETRASCRVYQQAGRLVRVVPTYDVTSIGPGGDVARGTPLIGDVTADQIRLLCSVATKFLKLETRKKEPEIKHVAPPEKLGVEILNRKDFATVRHLAAIATVPAIRPDGSIIKRPGWDAATAIIYQPSRDLEKFAPPQSATIAEMKESYKILFELMSDFPFVTEQDFCAWLAFLLTLLIRPTLKGCVPGFAFSSPTPGSGKGLLVSVAAYIAYGHDVTRNPYSENAEEVKKTLLGIIKSGVPLHFFDNISCTLGAAALDAVLTAETYGDRVLQTSQVLFNLPIKTTFCFSGNQLSYGGDIHRRIYECTIAPDVEDPENRTHFKYPLPETARFYRTAYVFHALRILKGHFTNPSAHVPKSDNFKTWESVVVDAIVLAGGVDPRKEIESASKRLRVETVEAFADAIQAIEKSKGVAGVLADDLTVHVTTYRWSPEQAPAEYRKMVEIYQNRKVSETITARNLGDDLRKIKDVVAGGKKIVALPQSAKSNKAKQWTVMTI